MKNENSFIKLYSAFNLQVTEPLDYRSIVDYKSDLLTLKVVPEGFVVTVLHDANRPAAGASSEAIATANGAEAAVYFLKSAPSTESANWEKLAINGNQYSATGLQFRGSFADQATALAQITTPAPDNGHYYYNQETKQFMVHNGSAWTKLCDLADFNITIANADSLSYQVSYNGVKFANDKNGDLDVTSLLTVGSNCIYKDENTNEYIIDPAHNDADNLAKIEGLAINDDDDHYVDGAQLTLFFSVGHNNVKITDEGEEKRVNISAVKINGDIVNIDEWEANSSYTIVYSSLTESWQVCSSSYTYDKFAFSLDTFDWKELIPVNNNGLVVSKTGEPIDVSKNDKINAIFTEIKRLNDNDTLKKAIHFLVYDSRRRKFDFVYDNSYCKISFIAGRYYNEITLRKKTVGNTVSYTCDNIARDIVADATTTSVSETNNNPVASSAVYNHTKPLFDALTWQDL